MNKSEFTLKHGFYFTVATTGIGFLGRKLFGEKLVDDPSMSFENFIKLLFVSFAVSAIEYKILSAYIDKKVKHAIQNNVGTVVRSVEKNVVSSVKNEVASVENKAKGYFTNMFG